MPTFRFDRAYIKEVGTAAGPMEKEGPIGSEIEKTYNDLHCEQKSWELAERKLMSDAIHLILNKTKMNRSDIDLFIGGDLLNQLTTTNFVARDLEVPFLGVYSACATSMESLMLAAIMVDKMNVKRVICGASSHNATAERQFRYPTEYGGSKKDTSTFTATAAGCALVSTDGKVKIVNATIGKVVDWKQKNPNDFGGAMAPAAYETISEHLKNLNEKVSDYDLIVTGDLGKVGKGILEDLFKNDNIKLDNHNDCGLILYDTQKQPVFSGGSGAGCAPVVTYSHLFNQLITRKYKRILVCATGALFSPTSLQQKETIPVICHAVGLEVS